METETMDFMDEYAGAGQEAFADVSTRAIPFLGMVQPDSNIEDESNPAGTWHNSASGKNYGNLVRVVPLAFHTVWAERENEAPYRTVARYAPHSIPVETRAPKAGKRGFPKMYSTTSGNEIVETYVYAVILPDFPEDGLMYFSPSVISMRTCRGWNSQLFGQLLPNGKQAPVFAYSWQLLCELVPNPQQPNKKISKFTRASKDVVVNKELFTISVKPQLEVVRQTTLLIEASSDTTDPVEE